MDAAVRLQTTFQDVGSRGMYGLFVLNGFVFQYLILIVFLVAGLLLNVLSAFSYSVKGYSLKYYPYNVRLELF